MQPSWPQGCHDIRSRIEPGCGSGHQHSRIPSIQIQDVWVCWNAPWSAWQISGRWIPPDNEPEKRCDFPGHKRHHPPVKHQAGCCMALLGRPCNLPHELRGTPQVPRFLHCPEYFLPSSSKGSGGSCILPMWGSPFLRRCHTFPLLLPGYRRGAFRSTPVSLRPLPPWRSGGEDDWGQ